MAVQKCELVAAFIEPGELNTQPTAEVLSNLISNSLKFARATNPLILP